MSRRRMHGNASHVMRHIDNIKNMWVYWRYSL
jgi:hypothetical protein